MSRDDMKPRVDHLEAGMTVTVTFRHPDDWGAETKPVTGELEDVPGALCLGRETIRNAVTGTPGSTLARVISPEPPPEPPLPIGQVRTSPDREWVGIRGDDEVIPWSIVDQGGSRNDVTDGYVRDWTVMIREDDPRVMPVIAGNDHGQQDEAVNVGESA